MEERRLQGARLLKEGVSQANVAQQLGVKRQSVHEWAKVMADQGEKGLASVPTGRKPRLNAVQLTQLAEHLQNGPQAHGYATALWTTERIAKLIHRRFGVRYHRDHVGRLLGQMGWSCQRPTGRARGGRGDSVMARLIRHPSATRLIAIRLLVERQVIVFRASRISIS